MPRQMSTSFLHRQMRSKVDPRAVQQPPKPPSWLLEAAQDLRNPEVGRRKQAATRIREDSQEVAEWSNFFGGALAVALVGDYSEQVRCAAAEALLAIGVRAAPYMDSVVMALKGDTVPAVRKAAADVLGAIGMPAAGHAESLYTKALHDSDLEVRKSAARALSNLGEAGPKQRLRIASTLLEDENPVVRYRAAEALGFAMGGAEASALTKASVNDKSAGVRLAAAQSLCKMGDTVGDSVGELSEELSRSVDPTRRKSAAKALGVLLTAPSTNHVMSAKAGRFNVTLIKRDPKGPLGVDTDTSDGQTILVLAVKDGLIKDWNLANPDRAIKPGCRIVSVNGFEGDVMLMKSSAKLAQVLEMEISSDGVLQFAEALKSSALRDEDDYVRHWASKSLSRLGTSALPSIDSLATSALHCQDDVGRTRAAEALGVVAGEQRASHAAKYAKTFADEHNGPNLRRNAIEALKELGSAAEPHRPALLAAARGAKEEEVRNAARLAVRTMKTQRRSGSTSELKMKRARRSSSKTAGISMAGSRSFLAQ